VVEVSVRSLTFVIGQQQQHAIRLTHFSSTFPN